jgi:hypothetical protein
MTSRSSHRLFVMQWPGIVIKPNTHLNEYVVGVLNGTPCNFDVPTIVVTILYKEHRSAIKIVK